MTYSQFAFLCLYVFPHRPKMSPIYYRAKFPSKSKNINSIFKHNMSISFLAVSNMVLRLWASSQYNWVEIQDM